MMLLKNKMIANNPLAQDILGLTLIELAIEGIFAIHYF